MKLYTKQGSLKYQTDCAPNNGYYMVPVYDRGDYILKVEPPPGWTFGTYVCTLYIIIIFASFMICILFDIMYFDFGFLKHKRTNTHLMNF